MGKKKESKKGDPFDLIAANYPFQQILSLEESDIEKLVNALATNIRIGIATKSFDYNELAAEQLFFVNKDYGLKWASKFWFEISTTPSSEWKDIFSSKQVQQIINDIYISEET